MGVVTEGIIAMPYELAMAGELTRMQFYQTVTSEIARLTAENEALRAEATRLRGELARVEAELTAVAGAIGGVEFMDPPDGGDVSLAEQVRRMHAILSEREKSRKRVEELEAGLRETFCPRPSNGRPLHFTAGECVNALECGCNTGALLRAKEERE